MPVSFEVFQARLNDLQEKLAAACARAGRDPGSVAILPITKNHPPPVLAHVARAGLAAVGENRVQEARDKRAACGDLPLQWELVGHLQSNKARPAVALFDRVQSVDSPRLLDVLEHAARDAARPLRILLQVNAGSDPAKFGCEPAAAPGLLEHALRCPHLRVEGLMTIAPLDANPDTARRTFARLRECRDGLRVRFGLALPELSMGMTGDWPAAIAEGSTQIRIGTLLFGERT